MTNKEGADLAETCIRNAEKGWSGPDFRIEPALFREVLVGVIACELINAASRENRRVVGIFQKLIEDAAK